jgi:hypothetical protein
MGYRGAPAENCRCLLQHLVDWLNDPSFQPDAEHGVIKPILAAILAHLYLAWIAAAAAENPPKCPIVSASVTLDLKNRSKQA